MYKLKRYIVTFHSQDRKPPFLNITAYRLKFSAEVSDLVSPLSYRANDPHWK